MKNEFLKQVPTDKNPGADKWSRIGLYLMVIGPLSWILWDRLVTDEGSYDFGFPMIAGSLSVLVFLSGAVFAVIGFVSAKRKKAATPAIWLSLALALLPVVAYGLWSLGNCLRLDRLIRAKDLNRPVSPAGFDASPVRRLKQIYGRWVRA